MIGIYHVSHIRQRKPHAHITHVFTVHSERDGRIDPVLCRDTGRFRRHFVWNIAQRFAENRSAEIRCRILSSRSISPSVFERAADLSDAAEVCVVYPVQKAAKARRSEF